MRKYFFISIFGKDIHIHFTFRRIIIKNKVFDMLYLIFLKNELPKGVHWTKTCSKSTIKRLVQCPRLGVTYLYNNLIHSIIFYSKWSATSYFVFICFDAISSSISQLLLSLTLSPSLSYYSFLYITEKLHSLSNWFRSIRCIYCTFTYIFHNGGPFPAETSLLICSTNQWSGFRIIETSDMKELTRPMLQW